MGNKWNGSYNLGGGFVQQNLATQSDAKGLASSKGYFFRKVYKS